MERVSFSVFVEEFISTKCKYLVVNKIVIIFNLGLYQHVLNFFLKYKNGKKIPREQ